MGFRFVGSIQGRSVDLPLLRQQMTLGSGDCDLVLRHDSVSRRHAQITVHEKSVEVVDLGSSNGTFAGTGRILTTRLMAGDEIVFGRVRLHLEETADRDLRPGLKVGPVPEGKTVNGRRRTTAGLLPADSFLTERLPHLLELLAGRASLTEVAQATGAALLDSLPALSVSISVTSAAGTSLLYQGSQRVEVRDQCRPLVARQGPFSVSIQLPQPAMCVVFAPCAETAALLVLLAETTVPPPPARRQHRRQPPPLPAPESVDLEVRRLYTEAATVADSDVGVLICGESGTGKEVLARYLHEASPRQAHPFVALNCAALPHDLLEAELFGIEQRVATGVDERPGKFEMAHGGTLFLDEIGDMDLNTQASILRVLQEHEVFRVGGTRPRKADVRVVAATNRDISQLRAEGSFREDLYYRIAAWEVTVPPLRERRSDICNLVAFFLDDAARRRQLGTIGVSEAALEVLVEYSWPGNIRQLQKEVERAALFVGEGGLLTTAHLSAKINEQVGGRPRLALEERLEQCLRHEVITALQLAQGDVGRAATSLGMSRSTLYRRLKELAIDPTAGAGNGDHRP